MAEAQLYLRCNKVNLYSKQMDGLHHIITNAGLHACIDKMQWIWDWWKPGNYYKVQHFLGLMQYLEHFMPDVTAYTTPLFQGVCIGRPFIWLPLDKWLCFQSIKYLLARPWSWIKSTWISMTPSRSYVMALNQESVPSMDRGLKANLLPCRLLIHLGCTAQYHTHKHETLQSLKP